MPARVGAQSSIRRLGQVEFLVESVAKGGDAVQVQWQPQAQAAAGTRQLRAGSAKVGQVAATVVLQIFGVVSRMGRAQNGAVAD